MFHTLIKNFVYNSPYYTYRQQLFVDVYTLILSNRYEMGITA